MGLKVAIVGLADSAKLAPWDDPQWQKWGLGWDSENWPNLQRTFEMHDISELSAKYIGELAYRTNLFTQDKYSQIPGCRRYPFEEVAASVADYFCSSIAYAMALAIHEGAEEIGVWGVNMEAADEYGYQKPNMEYLIGLARGRGIRVHLPADCPLCKFALPAQFTYSGRYGHFK